MSLLSRVRARRPRTLFALAVVLSSLSACGGGESGGAAGAPSGGNSPPVTAPPVTPPAPPQPPATSLTVTPQSISAEGATGSLPPTARFKVAIANPPEEAFYFTAMAQYTAVRGVDPSMGVRTEAWVDLEFWPPNALGAGSYGDTIRFVICSDNRCEKVIAEASIPVTYKVTGSPDPLTYFNAGPASRIQLEAMSADAQQPAVKVVMNVFDLPPQGLYVRFVEQPKNGGPKIVTKAAFRQTSNATGEFDFTLVAPATLSPRTYSSDLLVSLCFDSACSRTVIGSPQTVPVRYRIFASEGREFSKKDLALNARSLAWDKISQKLYVLQVTQTGNWLIAVDPVAGTAGTPVAVPDESTSVVISDDGQVAYVNSTYGGAVYRYRLPALVPDGTIKLPGYLQADRIAVAPGSHDTVAIVQLESSVEKSVAIYDGLVKRSTEGGPATTIAWGASAAELYSVHVDHRSTLHVWTADPSGLSADNPLTTSNSAGFAYVNRYDSGLLFSTRGAFIFDTAAGAFLTPFPDVCCGLLTLDIANDRAFSYESGALRSFVFSTRAEVATIRDQEILRPRDDAAVRWGTNGLAIVNYDGHLIILNGTFVAP